MWNAIVEQCNAFAKAWAWWMGTSILDTMIVLTVVSLLWFAIRRKASPQLGYLLFLLVPLKLFVPPGIALPERIVSWAPITASRIVSDPPTTAVPPSDARPLEPLVATNLPAAPMAAPVTAPRTASDDRVIVPETIGTPLLPLNIDTRSKLSALAWVMLGWLLGVLVLLTQLVHSQVRFHRVVIRSANPRDPGLFSVDLAALLHRIRVGQQIRIVESEAVSSPVVWGIVRPVLILPTGISSSLPARQMEWVLLHELAHVRRRDLAVRCLQYLVTILHFVNPAIWIANRMINRLREFACDDMALALGSGSQVESGEAFLGVMRYAASIQHRAELNLPGAIGVFESTTRALCYERMKRLLDTNRRVSVRLRLASICVLVATAALALPQIRAANPPLAEQPADGVVTKTVDSSAVLARPNLKVEPTSVDPRKLLQQVLNANALWLRRQMHPHSYTMLTEFALDPDRHQYLPDAWEAIVQYGGPDHVSVRSGALPCDEDRFPPYVGCLEGTYYEQQVIWLQGACFFGPMHEIAEKAYYHYPVQLVGEEKLDGVETQVLHIRGVNADDEEAVAVRQKEQKLWELKLLSRASGPNCVYEFTPIARDENGKKRIGLQMKYLLGQAADWVGLVGALSENPSEVHWGGLIITATTRQHEGKPQPVLVAKLDPDYEGTPPLTRIEIDDGENGTVRLDVYDHHPQDADEFVTRLGEGTRRLRLGEGWVLDPHKLERVKKEIYPYPHFGPDTLRPFGLTYGSIIGTRCSQGGSIGADLDQVWIEKATGRLLREEGFLEGQCRFLIQYGDYQRVSDATAVPRHVVVTVFGIHPEVFDMEFALHGGKVWLLKQLTHYAGEKRRVISTAAVRDVKLGGPGK